MGIAAGVGHFFESILEVFQGLFAAILHAFQFVLQTFVDLGKGAVNFIEGTLGFAVRKSLFFFFSSLFFLFPLPLPLRVLILGCVLTRFFCHTLLPPFFFRNPLPVHLDSLLTQTLVGGKTDNFFILGTVAAAVFGYMLYAQRQGTTPVSRTVKNK